MSYIKTCRMNVPHHQKDLQSQKLLEAVFFSFLQFQRKQSHGFFTSFTGFMTSLLMSFMGFMTGHFTSSGFSQYLKSWTSQFYEIVKILRYFSNEGSTRLFLFRHALEVLISDRMAMEPEWVPAQAYKTHHLPFEKRPCHHPK